MAEEKSKLDIELLKRVIEESGLSTMDLISKIIGLGDSSSCQHSGCTSSCVNCATKCPQGPDPSRVIDQYIIYPHEWERLKREILAELK